MCVYVSFVCIYNYYNLTGQNAQQKGYLTCIFLVEKCQQTSLPVIYLKTLPLYGIDRNALSCLLTTDEKKCVNYNYLQGKST